MLEEWSDIRAAVAGRLGEILTGIRCKLNKSLASSCYAWANRGTRPSPRESTKPADLNPAGFCMARNSAKNHTQPE